MSSDGPLRFLAEAITVVQLLQSDIEPHRLAAILCLGFFSFGSNARLPENFFLPRQNKENLLGLHSLHIILDYKSFFFTSELKSEFHIYICIVP